MRKALFVLLSMICGVQLHARECFLVQENGRNLRQEGSCDAAYSPNSTFKIALSLMGFDAKIFESVTSPSLPYSPDYGAGPAVCRTAHNPREWMRDSCVWFSQLLTTKLGFEKFNGYVRKFNYGNQNLTGDPGNDNGLSKAWLSSSLRITPKQQIAFIQDLVKAKLPVSVAALEQTKEILYLQELAGGWRLYGKTGNGRGDKNLQEGWFVGWIEKDKRQIIFAQHIADQQVESTYASFRARNEVLTKLWYLIDELSK